MPAPTNDSIHAFLLSVLGFLAAAQPIGANALAHLTPAEEYRGSIVTVQQVLAPYRTRMDMITFSGIHPTRCDEVPNRATICVYPLSKREPGWRPLAVALDTGDRLNLVCEFPVNDAPRSEDSCSVHSQRSNRKYYQRRIPRRRGGARSHKTAVRHARANLSAEARLLLAGARTAFELSTLVGDAPYQCRSGKNRVLCTWKTTAATYGHGTLAMSIDAPFRKKVRMNCSLPADGSPREPDSCMVEIGS